MLWCSLLPPAEEDDDPPFNNDWVKETQLLPDRRPREQRRVREGALGPGLPVGPGVSGKAARGNPRSVGLVRQRTQTKANAIVLKPDTEYLADGDNLAGQVPRPQQESSMRGRSTIE